MFDRVLIGRLDLHETYCKEYLTIRTPKTILDNICSENWGKFLKKYSLWGLVLAKLQDCSLKRYWRRIFFHDFHKFSGNIFWNLLKVIFFMNKAAWISSWFHKILTYLNVSLNFFAILKIKILKCSLFTLADWYSLSFSIATVSIYAKNAHDSWSINVIKIYTVLQKLLSMGFNFSSLHQ